MSIKVQHMQSSRGNDVPNQFIMEADNGNRYFQSYTTLIAKMSQGEIVLDKNNWDYSRTTLKYLNQFLGVKSKKEIEKRIESGEYKLANLYSANNSNKD